MAEFTIKTVAEQLGCSTQNIYKQVEYLIENGMAYRKDGHPYLNTSGYNYIMEKRKRTLENTTIQNAIGSNFIQEEHFDNAQYSNDNQVANSHEIVVEMYKNLLKKQEEQFEKRLEEEKQNVEFWKERFKEKDTALTEITSKFLLPGNTGNEKKTKKGFFSFFSK